MIAPDCDMKPIEPVLGLPNLDFGLNIVSTPVSGVYTPMQFGPIILIFIF